MSSQTIALFRQYAETQRHEAQEPKHKSQAQERSEQTEKSSPVVEMSRMEHAVRQMLDDASPAQPDNIIRFLEVLVRNLKRQAGND
jgi:hypothetical protein